MSPTAKNVFAKVARSSTTRKIGWWIAGTIVFIAVAGFLVAPPLVKSQLEKELTAQLHRRTTVERIRINPFAMTLAVQGFVVRERGGDEPVLSFEELHVDVSITSLYHLAPVVQELRLTKPRLRVVRNADKTYNFQDLIDEFLAKPAGPTPQFSLNNIEVIDGRIDIDDRPEEQQHQVTDLKLGIPFVSSLPYATKIKVQPALSARFDGAPFGLTGETRPFENTRDTTLDVNLDALQVARFLDYSPVALRIKLEAGQLDTRLRFAFAMLDNKPHRLTLAGTLALSKIDFRDPDGHPLLALPQLALEIEALDVLGQSVKIKSARIDGVDAYVKRLKDSSFNIVAFLQATAKGAPVAGKTKSGIPPDANSPSPAPPAKPFEFTIADMQITNSTLHMEDEVPARPVRKLLQNIEFSMQGLSNVRDTKAAGRLTFKSDTLNAFAWTGNVQIEPMRVDGKLDVSGFKLPALRPYYEDRLDLEIVQGTLDVVTSFSASQDAGKLQAQVSDLTAAVKSLQAKLPGDKDMLARVASLEVKGVAADFAKHSVTVSEVSGRDASTLVVRDKDGRLNLARVLKPAPAAADAGGGSGGAPWDVRVKRVALDRAAIDYQDLAQKAPNTVSVSELVFTGENFSNAKNARSQVTIRANINKTGRIALSGPVSIDPLSLVLNVETTALDLLPVQPLIADKLNIAITGGALSAKGALTLDAPPGAPVKATYKGGVEVTDFASIDNLTLEDLLKWKSLQIAGIDASLEPLQAAVAEITLTEFYSRLIVNADSTINLQNIVKKPGEPAAQGTSPPVAADAKPATANTATPAGKPLSPAQAGDGAAETPSNLSIGKITLRNGAVNFTDHFIKPNYSADLSEITGSVGRITRDTPGDVELTGHVQKTAPLVIAGRVNPLAKDLFLDIKASAKDVELPPLTAYSVKYAGYGIEKGKLSMDVKYRLENRKLVAENHLNLDQLTFGKKVDSPTATKLPVLLAVALLKDRNGVIDINLPISGSLDDPQFSMGGIIGRIILNLLVKIITSPFALIGSLFGGGGEELAYVEFTPGHAAITPEAAKKLSTVAKGLNDRPALKMEITGHADPDSDREGLRQSSLERKVKAQKLKATLKSGEAAPSLDDIKVEPAEYEKYLTAAYRDEKFTKPRNLIGMAKSLPVPEMEKLMLENAQVADDDLQQLADQRAQAVKDNLVRTGKIEPERVFLTASKTSAAGAKDKGKANRADFALK